MANKSRRSFMGLFAALPFFAAAAPAMAFQTDAPVPAALNIQPAGGLWNLLVRATDGTNPSTSITTELPRFTPEIRQLAGQVVELEGYLQPLGHGFGKAEYVLGRMPYHCSFCFVGGRAALALVQADTPLAERDASTKVKISGTLVLQETVPDDFYYQIKNARLV